MPPRLLILGAGGLGTVLAGYLARSGLDVTIFVKPEQAQQFVQQEVQITGAAEFAAPVHVLSDPAQLGSYEYAIVCVKARDTASSLAVLRSARFESVLSLQNGAGKNDLLVERFGRARVLGALTYVAGALVRPGYAHSSNPAATFVGELDGAGSVRAQHVAAAFERAGLPATVVPNIVTLEWYKLAVFLRTALVSALTRLDLARLTESAALCRVCAAVAREVAAVAAAEGHSLPREAFEQFSLAGPPPPGRSPAAIDATEDELRDALAALGASLRRQGRTFYPSLAQDMMAGRPTELEATAGDVLARGARHGLTLPVLATCTVLLRGIESARAGSKSVPADRRNANIVF